MKFLAKLVPHSLRGRYVRRRCFISLILGTFLTIQALLFASHAGTHAAEHLQAHAQSHIQISTDCDLCLAFHAPRLPAVAFGTVNVDVIVVFSEMIWINRLPETPPWFLPATRAPPEFA